MTCNELTNDQMLAPTAEVSSHLAGCEECRERQQAVTLAVRAMRALAGEHPVPDVNDRIVRAAIPQLAADAARRRPAGWWQVAAAAAVLLASVVGGLKFAASRQPSPAAGLVADRDTPEAAQPAGPRESTPPAVPAHPPVGPKVVPPPDPGPTVEPPPPEPVPDPPTGHGYLAGGDLPPLPQPPVKPQPGLPKPADLLADVSVADCMEIMRTVLGEGEPVSRDLNGDGVTDVIDAFIAARRVAGDKELK